MTTRNDPLRPVSDAPRKHRRPVVSVCIVNWNCRDLLRGCLRSLRSRRQGLRVEVVVVDNASTDGAAEMVEREFPRVKLIRNPTNAGFARGNNQAAAIVRGATCFSSITTPWCPTARCAGWSSTHAPIRAWGFSGRVCVMGAGRCSFPHDAGPPCQRWPIGSCCCAGRGFFAGPIGATEGATATSKPAVPRKC